MRRIRRTLEACDCPPHKAIPASNRPLIRVGRSIRGPLRRPDPPNPSAQSESRRLDPYKPKIHFTFAGDSANGGENRGRLDKIRGVTWLVVKSNGLIF
jgi:hypothetical protein